MKKKGDVEHVQIKLVHNDHGYNEFLAITNKIHFRALSVTLKDKRHGDKDLTLKTKILSWSRRIRHNRV
jgi:hypothetical protein